MVGPGVGPRGVERDPTVDAAKKNQAGSLKTTQKRPAKQTTPKTGLALAKEN